MSLWGGSSADESKPKFLVRGSAVAEPDNCIATEQGWVYRHYQNDAKTEFYDEVLICLLYTSPSPRDQRGSRMPSSA